MADDVAPNTPLSQTELQALPDRQCACAECQQACQFKPGWFLPGEAEHAAELLGLSLQEFFDTYLLIDYWGRDAEEGGDIFILSPAIRGATPGGMFPGNPEGQCVFYRDGGCQIYAARPWECRKMNPCEPPAQDPAALRGQAAHDVVAGCWDQPHVQTQVRQLLGREPSSDWEWAWGELGRTDPLAALDGLKMVAESDPLGALFGGLDLLRTLVETYEKEGDE